MATHFFPRLYKNLVCGALKIFHFSGGWVPALLFCMAVLVVIPSSFAASSLPPLASPPLGERWFTLSMNDEKTGFGYVKISRHSPGYEIMAENSAKILVLGFSREAASKERYLVNDDLSLRSFAVEQSIDGSAMKISGEVTRKGVKVSVESKGSRKERLLKAKGAIFPPPVLNLYPLMKGATAGKKYNMQMVDVEGIGIRNVKIEVAGFEKTAEGVEAVHLQNDLYTVVSNDVWVDRFGNTIRESVRDGMIETRAEQEQAARKFVVESALSKKDLILDFSRIPVAEPIDAPQQLSVLKVEIFPFPESVPVTAGAGQQAARLDGERVLFTIDRTRSDSVSAGAGNGADLRYLDPSEWILADSEEIIAMKKEILEGERDPLKVVERLNGWVAATITDAVTDSRSPIETLATKKGNCQSHARLYASLARAAGIPTKFVSGLVYVPGQGFLYHSWAESYAGGWLAVDPTFGQLPADVTHIKLAEGESPQDMAPMIGLIGKIKLKIVEKGRKAGIVENSRRDQPE